MHSMQLKNAHPPYYCVVLTSQKAAGSAACSMPSFARVCVQYCSLRSFSKTKSYGPSPNLATPFTDILSINNNYQSATAKTIKT